MLRSNAGFFQNLWEGYALWFAAGTNTSVVVLENVC